MKRYLFIVLMSSGILLTSCKDASKGEFAKIKTEINN
jgi:hypothetical protein